jgi:hypothetical protein
MPATCMVLGSMLHDLLTLPGSDDLVTWPVGWWRRIVRGKRQR